MYENHMKTAVLYKVNGAKLRGSKLRTPLEGVF